MVLQFNSATSLQHDAWYGPVSQTIIIQYMDLINIVIKWHHAIDFSKVFTVW